MLGQNFPFTQELIEYLLRNRVGIIQYPCPETTAMGLMRNPQGRQQYDNIFFRQHCKELLKIPLLMAREFMENKYRMVCYIGLENSPSCGIHWGKHKVNKYQTESPEPVTTPSPDDPILMGIMAEILAEEFNQMGVEVPFLEFPAKSEAGDKRRTKFWCDLKTLVAPYMEHEECKDI
jgi:hypothetical protein